MTTKAKVDTESKEYKEGQQGFIDGADCPYPSGGAGRATGYSSKRFLWWLGYFHERIAQKFGRDVLAE